MLNMMKRYGPFAMIPIVLLTLYILLIRNGDMQLLNPQGYIAEMQSHILWAALILGFLIAFSIIGTTFFVAFHYREERAPEQYEPNWVASKRTITIWFATPLVAIMIISGFVWGTAHTLDQYKPIPSTVSPLAIQVVALQWKWLFIYPQQQIASVNFLEVPANTPLDFQLTADAPMSSFWIPKLGGQIYEMPGMVTQLHLIANTTGDFPGLNAQISGRGFASMDFVARSTSQSDFTAWVQSVKQSQQTLDMHAYNALAQPSSNYPKKEFVVTNAQLFHDVLMKYMAPSTTTTGGK